MFRRARIGHVVTVEFDRPNPGGPLPVFAEALGVPEEIRSRPPTTDTYSMPQSQEEFYFSLPYHSMDLCLYAVDNGVPQADVAAALQLSEEQVDRVFKDIASKRRMSEYLHAAPVVLENPAD